MRITPLTSGSQGNCLVLEAGRETVLVDIGLDREDLEARLTAIEVDPQDVTAVCMTHRHRDHSRGVAEFCLHHKVPVYGSRRTLRALTNELTDLRRIVKEHGQFAIGSVDCLAIELSHDAPQTVAFRFTHDNLKFGIATDLGCSNPTLEAAFHDLDGLLLEFNYDPWLLATGPYPSYIRNRVSSNRGHLSNKQAAELLGKLSQSQLQIVWLGHISQKNNQPELAVTAAQEALRPEFEGELRVADQNMDDPAPAVIHYSSFALSAR